MSDTQVEFSPVPRRDEVAAHIVHKCLRVQPGELVGLTGGIHQYWLLSQMSVEVRKAGAFPFLQINDDRTSLAKVNEISEEYLGDRHPALKTLSDEVDVQFYLKPQYDPRTSGQFDLSRLQKINEKRKDEVDKERTYRVLVMEWPTPPKAEVYGLTYEEFQDFFWKAFWIDLEELTSQATRLKDKLQGSKGVDPGKGNHHPVQSPRGRGEVRPGSRTTHRRQRPNRRTGNRPQSPGPSDHGQCSSR